MKFVVIIILLFAGFRAQAQQNNVWYFGNNAGIDFSGGTPVPLTDGQINTLEGCSSIADSDGHLLFYTDGVTIWNKNHGVMDNGAGLTGHNSSIQSALIVPLPGSSTIYYVFTTTAGGYAEGFRYSVIDMGASNGLGAVSQLNVPIHTPTSEAVAAAYHQNGQDIWIVSHRFNSNIFSAYLLTSNGLSGTPVESAIGPILGNDGHSSMKISPDASRLAYCIQQMQGGTQVYDFDSISGILSNPVYLPQSNDYSAEFSPSGNLLYVCNLGQILQYDLLSADIAASGTVVAATNAESFSGQMATLQRGPDGKIYIARKSLNILSVVTHPDVIGMGCDFQETGVVLGIEFGQNNCAYGLPNILLQPVFSIAGARSLCVGELTDFTVGTGGGFENFHWEFGDGSTSTEMNPSYSYQSTGIFVIKVTADRQGVIRIAETTVTVLQIPQISSPENLYHCDDDGTGASIFNLRSQDATILGQSDAEGSAISYHSSLADAVSGTGALPAAYMNTSNPQLVYARMEDAVSGCYATASFMLIVNPKAVIAMDDDYYVCRGGSLVLAAPEGFEAYSWSNGENTRIITVSIAGELTLTVTGWVNGQLCSTTKLIAVHQSDVPVIAQVSASDWTDDQNSIAIKVLGNGIYEYSVDGEVYQDNPEFTGLENGLYTVYARDKNGCGLAQQETVLLMYPKFFTPNGDGINDFWSIPYSRHEPGLEIHIFDRYGKQVASLGAKSLGWDGTFDGYALPSTDYWFVVVRKDGRQHSGHFAMLR